MYSLFQKDVACGGGNRRATDVNLMKAVLASA
jgi:hypothetical protein